MSRPNRITNVDLAEFFIRKAEKEDIILEVFSFLEVDCMARVHIDPHALDCRVAEFQRSGYADTQALAGVIEMIRDAQRRAARQEKELIEKVRAYIDENYTDDLHVEKMAEELHVSYYYLCHAFKSGVGLSINEYRNKKRIELAVKKLLGTDEKIASIATACGFNSISYFTEVFSKLTGEAPTAFRTNHQALYVHEFYSLDDVLLASKMQQMTLLDKKLTEVKDPDMVLTPVHMPDEQFSFLHEAAIIEYHGVLYAAWYNNHKMELLGYTPICGRRSYDGGKTWTPAEILVHDPSEKILYCPPVFGICGDTLYMLVNQMVAPDHIHSVDLYALNHETQRFELRWSRPIPFKLNTNVVRLPNGKLMLPGRMGELDGFPNTPAVLISDNGSIDAPWRLVKIAENGDLPDGKKLVYPEISVMIDENVLYMFCRNDPRCVPLVYVSRDFGESWSEAYSHDIPCRSSKIYSGDLSDGRKYLIANTLAGRKKLTVFFTEKNGHLFSKYVVLFDSEAAKDSGIVTCHYPSACEYDGKLYIITTVGYESSTGQKRGAGLTVIDLKCLDAGFEKE